MHTCIWYYTSMNKHIICSIIHKQSNHDNELKFSTVYLQKDVFEYAFHVGLGVSLLKRVSLAYLFGELIS